uniref:Uncharacterized protein n=1 Tax=Oryza meridionalis TaxID=40149 RepID=A0A0E0F5K1_9ORYZ
MAMGITAAGAGVGESVVSVVAAGAEHRGGRHHTGEHLADRAGAGADDVGVLPGERGLDVATDDGRRVADGFAVKINEVPIVDESWQPWVGGARAKDRLREQEAAALRDRRASWRGEVPGAISLF